MAQQKLIEADLNLVTKIVREAIAYAQDLGFRRDSDYRDAVLELGDGEPDAFDVPIPLCGPEGRPFFVAGTCDNVDRIMAKLTRQPGPHGCNHLVVAGGDGEFSLLDQ